MLYTDKKRLLELYHDIVVDIMLLTQEAQELREDMLPTSPKLSDMPKSHNVNDPMAMFAARLDQIEREQIYLIKAMQDIRNGVNRLGGADQRFLLASYYLRDGWTWGRIAGVMKISERSARRKAHAAIKEICFDHRLATAMLKRYGRKN